MTDQVIGAHNDLHSEQGALKGEHAGRSANPIIKVQDVIWLEFEKPDLVKAEAFAQAFGFSTALRTDEELHLRGSDAGAPCVLIRRGPAREVSRARRLLPRSSPIWCGWPTRPGPPCARCRSRWAG